LRNSGEGRLQIGKQMADELGGPSARSDDPDLNSIVRTDRARGGKYGSRTDGMAEKTAPRTVLIS
jgi:hypothetical protein